MYEELNQLRCLGLPLIGSLVEHLDLVNQLALVGLNLISVLELALLEDLLLPVLDLLDQDLNNVYNTMATSNSRVILSLSSPFKRSMMDSSEYCTILSLIYLCFSSSVFWIMSIEL